MTRTLIQGGQVFDSGGGDTSIADVVIEDDRIIDVGSSLDGDEAIDATGHAVYPGFIDCHVHFMADGNLDPMSAIRTPFSMNFYLAAERMARTLATGITTVREAGGSDLGVKEAQSKGMVPGRTCRSPSRSSARPVVTVTIGRCAGPTCRAGSSATRIPASRTTSSTAPMRCGEKFAS